MEENFKMLVLPEKRRVVSASYERAPQSEPPSSSQPDIELHSMAPPYEEEDHHDDFEPRPEVPPKTNDEHDAHAVPEPGHNVEQAGDGFEVETDFDKYPINNHKHISLWKRRKLGRSLRFWFILGLCVIVVLIVGAIVGVHFGRKSNFNYDGPFTFVSTPVNVTLDCPSINQTIYNSSLPSPLTEVNGIETSTNTSITSQFKQFCNKDVIAVSTSMTLITAEQAISTGFENNPASATSMNSCMTTCASYNIELNLNAENVTPCFGVWFDVNSTAIGFDNCYLYTIPKAGNDTVADLLVESGGSTAMAVLVSWKNSTLIGSYLSNNGDWSGGINTTTPSLPLP